MALLKELREYNDVMAGKTGRDGHKVNTIIKCNSININALWVRMS